MVDQVIRLKPYHYMHVSDNNTSVTTLYTGPKTVTVLDHEVVVTKPTPMIIFPPMHYCRIKNPAKRDAKGNILYDKYGNVALKYEDEKVIYSYKTPIEPFPLYPGEVLLVKPTRHIYVHDQTAIKIRAIRDYEDHGIKYKAGHAWTFKGPGTYIVRVEQEITETIYAKTIGPNQAAKLKAWIEFTDSQKIRRTVGEVWLYRKPGPYIQSICEDIVEIVDAIVLDDKTALHLQATHHFTDIYGVERKSGEEWLVTNKLSTKHIVDVFETLVKKVDITILNSRQYCIILDPFDQEAKKPALGHKKLVKGETAFFLQPGEKLMNGILDVYVLEYNEALLLSAKEAFTDADDKVYTPGDRWMIHGPTDYIPPVQVEVLQRRKAIPLDVNEGIYVRNIKTGRVRVCMGSTYMITADEELWEKELPPAVEELLLKDPDPSSGIDIASREPRPKYRAVTYRIPSNAAVQVYDYLEKKQRIAFGPELVILGPDEQFTLLNLSGQTPKEPKKVKVIALLLGPRFSTDIVNVETSDHARMALTLSYNWKFDIDGRDQKKNLDLFSVPDFIGDMCKAIASRIRSAVTSTKFDSFHKNFSSIINKAVFSDGNTLRFPSNNLLVTGIDIQSVQPIDTKTKDALQKSVQLAIEITTQSLESEARHKAESFEQKSKFLLERQALTDNAELEISRRELLRLKAESAAVDSTGSATAEALARSMAADIEGQSAVKLASLKAEASDILTNNAIKLLKQEQEIEIHLRTAYSELEIHKASQLAEIEIDKFKQIVDAITPQTISLLSRANDIKRVETLKYLNLSSILVTTGKTPINLFKTANGLIGNH